MGHGLELPGVIGSAASLTFVCVFFLCKHDAYLCVKYANNKEFD
jgi:hypothetical protein